MAPTSEKALYRFIISLTAHWRAPAAFLGSVTTGMSRWGMPLYTPSSTILGSTMIRRTSSGVALYNRETMRELVHTDLPEPVVPAMSMWGSLAMLPTTQLPPISLPTAKDTLELLSMKALEPITSRMATGVTWRLGTSIPTVEILSGMGATRTADTPRARAMSSDSLVSLFSLTPCSSSSS